MGKKYTLHPVVIQYSVFMLGLAVMGFGIGTMIEANLGVAPWDTLHIGLQKTFGLTIGTWSQIVGLMIIVSSYVIGKIKPSVGMFLNMFFFGLFIDLFMWLGWIPVGSTVVERIVLFAAGLLIYTFGTGMYISPRLGAGPRDSFMLALHERTGWDISKVRIGIECTVTLLGFLLGGPVSVGTLVTAFSIGPLIKRFIPFWERVMKKLYGGGVTAPERELAK
ncbi:YitT family protein [Brevibacillus choshinensis]|uniref:YczE/YyaS/YitT family protein n=1 Tax=Brevibacillus choshinensis TaxID=54911 RepID=UPI002E23B8A2|nr:YitT family protein [Brevibacillus choshinensis]MED4750398.1 YitT family protein [Brevibacillus choshinensis]MED4780998.1 YitT family protein [Brevibacillus choshinensis]